MFGHTPIQSNRDRAVRVLADDIVVSASTAQSEYARALNFIGDRFTAVTNTVSGIKTYDIALKYADKIIPYEAGVAKGSTPGWLNFDGDHFDVSALLASQMYTVTSTGRIVPYEAAVAKGATLGFLNFDGNHFDVSALATDKYTVTSTGWAKVNAFNVKPLNIVNATNNEAVTAAEGASTIDLTFNNDEVNVYSNAVITTAAPRALNFDPAFTVTDDSVNDRVTIALTSSGSGGGVVPAPSGLVRGGIRDLSIPFGDGIFNIPHNYQDGTPSGGNSTTHGHFRRYSVDDTDNSLLGATTDFPMTQLSYNPHLYGKLSINSLDDSRFILGWSSAEPPVDDNTFLDNLSGFMLGFQNDTAETEDTNVQIIRNDGDATEDKVSTGLAMSSTTPFTFELVGDTTGNRWRWNVNDGAFTDYSTTGGEVPLTNTNLNWNFRMETIGGDAGSLVIDVYYLYWLQDR